MITHPSKWRRTGPEVPVCRKSSKLNKNWCGVRYTIMEAGFQILSLVSSQILRFLGFWERDRLFAAAEN